MCKNKLRKHLQIICYIYIIAKYKFKLMNLNKKLGDTCTVYSIISILQYYYINL